MLYIESESFDPAFNLALEQYLFDGFEDGIFMLWRNSDAVIVGLHQNTAEEVNGAYLKQSGIPVVRRLSGGGAVFHDLGNLNFSIIKDVKDNVVPDFFITAQPIIEALKSLGVSAVAGGRNDITVDGNKISGNARYFRGGRLQHHGTILFSVDLSRMSQALRPPEDKYSSKGIRSVRARVANLQDYLPKITMPEFIASIREHITGKEDVEVYALTEEDRTAVEDIRKNRYDTRDWNWGMSPDYNVEKRRRVDGAGAFTVRMLVEGGVIKDFSVSGDYFGNRPAAELAGLLKGIKLDEQALADKLSGVALEEYCEGLNVYEFIRILLD